MTMSLLENLLAPGTIERLGWMLMHVLWQATAVAVLLAVFLRLLRSAGANVRYGVACSALALMVALPLITMRYLRTPGPVAEAGPASGAVVLPTATEGTTPERDLSVPDSGYALDTEDTLKASLSVPPIAQTPEPMAPIPLRERLVSALEPALPYVVLGWLIGVFGLSAWHLGGWTQLQRLKRRMVREIGDPLQRRLAELSARLGLHRGVGLLESALVEVPTVIGWLRPVILLPASALTGLRPEQLEAILAHELAHIRRYDYLVNMLQTVVEILGFYHPAIWWVSRRIREERENCCDDLAVYVCGSSLQYAKALACMEEIRHGGTDLAMAATGGSLMARIARLLGRPAVEDRRFAWLPGLITLLLVVAIVIPAALTLGAGNPQQSSMDTRANYETPRQEHEAQAAPARLSPGDATGPVEGQDTDTTRADAEADNAADEKGHVLLEFRIFTASDDLRPNETALQQLAQVLGDQSPLAQALRQPGRELNLTLGEVLKRYIAPQPLPEEAGAALMRLLQSQSGTGMLAAPRIMPPDGEPAHLRIADKHFLPGLDPSAQPEGIEYGTFIKVTPHVLDANWVSLEMLAEVSDLVPGSDPNRPAVGRTSAEASVTARNNRYLIWAAAPSVAGSAGQDKDAESLYIMVKPTILPPTSEYAAPTRDRQSTEPPRQVLLDVRTVTMERGALLNLGVEWNWPTTRAGVFAPPAADGAAGLGRGNTWPGGVQIGYTPDRAFTDSLLAALDLLQKNGQAHVSGQQILAQDGRKSRIKALTEEWYTVTASATKQSPQPRAEAHKTETGTVIAITPHISDKGVITLETAIEASAASRCKDPDLPLITRRTARNTVTIRDGGTVAVAGLTENRTGPNDKSVHETAIFVTAHLIPDINEAALPAPQGATSTHGQQATISAAFANTDLLSVLADLARQTGVTIATDMTVKPDPVSVSFPSLVGEPVSVALQRIVGSTKTTYKVDVVDDRTYKVYRPISNMFPGVELVNALQDLSTASGVPIIADPNVTGQVNLILENVSLEEALDMMLAGKPYVYKRMPRYYLVADRGIHSRIFPEISETRRIRLNYTRPSRAKELLAPVVAPYVQVEPSRTQDPNDEAGTLIITAPPAIADRIVADIKKIDRPKRQVLLDARVVVMEHGDLLNLGVQWDWPKTVSPVFPDRAPDPNTGTVSNSWPGGVHMGYTPDRVFTDSLTMALNLLQENGKADIIANPKVIARDGRQTQMKVATEWFGWTNPAVYSYITRAELSKIEPGTVMTITPHVGDNNDITLEMAVEVTDSIPKVRGSDLPLITRRTVKNAVTVKDGGTVAVAGLIENRGKNSEKRVPGLANLPLIGELFKNRNSRKTRRELVVFVTAHLIPEVYGASAPAAVAEIEAQAQKTADNAGAEQTPTANESTSRAWHIMR